MGAPLIPRTAQRLRLRWFLGLALLVAVGSAAGCSILGLGVGAAVDGARPDYDRIPGWEFETLEAGQDISVIGAFRRIDGRYVGAEPVDESVYAERYARALERLPGGTGMPQLHERVTVSLDREDGENVALRGEMLGFDVRTVHVLPAGETAARRVDLGRVTGILAASGDAVVLPELERMLRDGRLPHRTALAVATPDGITLVPLDEVMQVEVRVRKRGKVNGFLLGGIVDAAIVIAILSNPPEVKLRPKQGATSGGNIGGGLMSCPFVYSFDGSDYILDAETFGGAIFPAAQRTDFDRLDHLRETDGAYRLQLTNELDETQFVDELKLVVVDHPPGTSVVSTFGGDLHVLSSPQRPIRARDFAGRDVLPLVAATDGDVWASSPFGRNAQRKEEARDGLELAFARPPGASRVRLAVHVKNTMWASYVQRHLLELFGTDLDEWYARLDESPRARQALFDAMIREGMLLAKVWDGTSWRPLGFVWEVGPVVSRDQVVCADIDDIPGDELRVRLESTAGFWILDQVSADFGPDVPADVVELDALVATDHDGADVRDVLGRIDDRRYAMPTPHDRVALVFPAPLLRPGCTRSVLVRCTGYYTIHTSGEGEPQDELIARLLREPGAYGQYTLGLLGEHLRVAAAAGEGGP